MILSTALFTQEQKGIVVEGISVEKLPVTETLPKACPIGKSLQCGKKAQTGEICVKREKCFLMSRSTIQGMIRRLLIENKMPKEELAKILAIRKKQLEYFAAKQGSEKLRAKINLPLIKLYCKTRWKQK
jgi:hypothetical protein